LSTTPPPPLLFVTLLEDRIFLYTLATVVPSPSAKLQYVLLPSLFFIPSASL
jgi:hypothetical protein